jgi:hypothetical protein
VRATAAAEVSAAPAAEVSAAAAVTSTSLRMGCAGQHCS